jgi:hypothetical protein
LINLCSFGKKSGAFKYVLVSLEWEYICSLKTGPILYQNKPFRRKLRRILSRVRAWSEFLPPIKEKQTFLFFSPFSVAKSFWSVSKAGIYCSILSHKKSDSHHPQHSFWNIRRLRRSSSTNKNKMDEEYLLFCITTRLYRPLATILLGKNYTPFFQVY